MNFTKSLLLSTLLLTTQNSFSFENSFYILRSNLPSEITNTKNQYDSLTKNYKSVDVLISQAYQVGANGLVWGFVDPDVLAFAKKNHVRLMILVTNKDFDKDVAHKFLADQSAQKKAIAGLIDVCRENQYYGVQLDFEMVPLADRDALTRFYQDAATAFHKEGLAVSFAVAPLLSDSPQQSDFLKKLYENWEGAYDLKALGQAADFITIMTYNQHGQGTTPGPTASYQWVEESLKFALKNIPADKISLGIPSYSAYWFTTTNPENHKITVSSSGIGYDKVTYLLNKYRANVQWNDNSKNNYAIYDHNWLNEYLFIEDKKSFQSKFDLAKKYRIRGISVFYIGIEDPKIWDVLSRKG